MAETKTKCPVWEALIAQIFPDPAAREHYQMIMGAYLPRKTASRSA